MPVSDDIYTEMDFVPAGIVKTGALLPGELYFASTPNTSALLPPLGPQGLEGIWPNTAHEQNTKMAVRSCFM